MTGLSSTAVIRLTGVSYRKLDYWDKAGIVSPSIRSADGSGSHRRYSAMDVAHVAVIQELLNAGFSLNAAFKLIQGMTTRPARLALDRVEELVAQAVPV